jgi:hypothetical protein
MQVITNEKWLSAVSGGMAMSDPNGGGGDIGDGDIGGVGEEGGVPVAPPVVAQPPLPTPVVIVPSTNTPRYVAIHGK